MLGIASSRLNTPTGSRAPGLIGSSNRSPLWSKSGVLLRLLVGLAKESDDEGYLIDALFDALRVIELVDEQTHREGKELLVRVVSMLSKMC